MIFFDFSKAVVMFHVKPSALSLAYPRCKLTNFADSLEDGNDFDTVGEFDTNLVNQNG